MWRIIIGSFLSSRYMGLLLLLPRIVRNSDVIEDTADGGGLTVFWELFIMIACMLKHLKR